MNFKDTLDKPDSMQPHFTPAFIKKVTFPGNYREKISPLCLRVTKNGTKTFAVMRRRKGSQEMVTVVVGRVEDVSLKDARDKADAVKRLLRQGIDPNEVRRQEVAEELEKKIAQRTEGLKANITLDRCLLDYLSAKTLKPGTVYNYNCVITAYLKDWLRMPLLEITRSMVQIRHASISETNGKGAANNAMRVLRALFTYASFQYVSELGETIINHNPTKVLSQLGA